MKWYVAVVALNVILAAMIVLSENGDNMARDDRTEVRNLLAKVEALTARVKTLEDVVHFTNPATVALDMAGFDILDVSDLHGDDDGNLNIHATGEVTFVNGASLRSVQAITPLSGFDFELGNSVQATTIRGAPLTLVGIPTTEQSAAYTATQADKLILVDASGGPVTITLPQASIVDGQEYTIKKIDASSNTVTIDGNAAELIDEATTQALSNQYEALTVQCDGTEWWIL